MTPPGFSLPSRSAASIIARPIRSLTEPPGLKNSALAYTGVRVDPVTRLRRMSGVHPMVSSTFAYGRAWARGALLLISPSGRRAHRLERVHAEADGHARPCGHPAIRPAGGREAQLPCTAHSGGVEQIGSASCREWVT